MSVGHGQILTPDVQLESKGRPIIDIAASRPLISNLVVTVAFLTSTALARVQPFPLEFKAQTISTNGAKVHLRMGARVLQSCCCVATAKTCASQTIVPEARAGAQMSE